MKKVLLETNLNKMYVIVMIIISLFLIGGYFSYAMFTVSKEKKNAISIVTGNLTYEMTINEEKTDIIKIPKGSIRDYEIVFSNPNDRKTKYTIAYKQIDGVTIGYLSDSENIPPKENGMILEKTGSSGSQNIYKLRVRNETSEDLNIQLIINAGLDYNELTINKDEKIIEEYDDILLKTFIMNLKNESTNKDYQTSSDYEKSQMYTFAHNTTAQQSGWTTDELTDYRYIGGNPNNYIKFNNELWRIVGVSTVEKSDGTKEQLIKIMRNESIGNLSWDATSTGNYSDIWSNAESNKMLNGAYLNSTTMKYYNYNYVTQVVSSVNLDFTNTGLKNVSDKIESVKWYTAAVPYNNGSYVNLKGEEFYSLERANLTVTNGSKSWVGKVALFYPSDFIYTTAYNYNNSCYNKPIENEECNLKPTWLISSKTVTTLSRGRNMITLASSQYLYLYSSDVSNQQDIVPNIYLKSNILVTNGSGTKENPFLIS